MNRKIFFLFAVIAYFNHNVSQSSNFFLTIGNTQSVLDHQKNFEKKYFTISAKQKKIIAGTTVMILFAFFYYYFLYPKIKRRLIVDDLERIQGFFYLQPELKSITSLEKDLEEIKKKRKDLFIEINKLKQGGSYVYLSSENGLLKKESIPSLTTKLNNIQQERTTITDQIKEISCVEINENISITELNDLLKKKQNSDINTLMEELKSKKK